MNYPLRLNDFCGTEEKNGREMVRVIFSVDKAHNKRFDFDFLFIFYIKWAAF